MKLEEKKINKRYIIINLKDLHLVNRLNHQEGEKKKNHYFALPFFVHLSSKLSPFLA